MFHKLVVFCIVSAVLLTSEGSILDLPKCNYEDSICFTKVANEAISKGKLADNDLGLGVFDPLKVKMFSIDQNTGQVQLKIEMENFEFQGMSAIKFTKVDGFRKNFEKAKIELKFNFPEIFMQGPYKISGKFLILPVTGSGICNMSYTDNDIVLRFLGKKVERNGKQYLEVDKYKHTFETKGVKVHFGGLFGGTQKELADTANLFFNENWRDILKEIRPAVSDSLGKLYLGLFNKVFSMKPYEDFFLS